MNLPLMQLRRLYILLGTHSFLSVTHPESMFGTPNTHLNLATLSGGFDMDPIFVVFVAHVQSLFLVVTSHEQT